jgi:hypothetical protein
MATTSVFIPDTQMSWNCLNALIKNNMKTEVSIDTINAFLSLRGKWLILNSKIAVIRELQYVCKKAETHEPTPVKTKWFKRNRVEPKKDRYFVTKLVINVYHEFGEVVSIYKSEYCEELLQQHDSNYYTFNIYHCRTAWRNLKTQIDAMKTYEQELMKNGSEEEQEFHEVINLIRNDRALEAMKVYKDMTGKTLQESKDAIMEFKNKYQ